MNKITLEEYDRLRSKISVLVRMVYILCKWTSHNLPDDPEILAWWEKHKDSFDGVEKVKP